MIPLRYYANTAGVLGAFITTINLYGVLQPRATLAALGFPLPLAPTDRTLVGGITRMFCGTRVALGVTMLAMWYHRDHKALGVSMVAGSIMAIVDGIVSRSVTGKGEWMHWGSLPVSFVVGLGLLGNFQVKE